MLTEKEKLELEELMEEFENKYKSDALYESLSSEEQKRNYLNEFGKLTSRLFELKLKEQDLLEEKYLPNGARLLARKDINMEEMGD